MLRLIAATLLCAGASAAGASSIESFKETSSTRSSIVEIGCHECARAAEAAAQEAEVRLEPGEQIIEVREVDGEKKIYRTEGWLGGSPVTMVSKASEANLIALGLAGRLPMRFGTASAAILLALVVQEAFLALAIHHPAFSLAALHGFQQLIQGLGAHRQNCQCQDETGHRPHAPPPTTGRASSSGAACSLATRRP